MSDKVSASIESTMEIANWPNTVWIYKRENEELTHSYLSYEGQNGWELATAFGQDVVTGEKLVCIWKRPDTRVHHSIKGLSRAELISLRQNQSSTKVREE